MQSAAALDWAKVLGNCQPVKFVVILVLILIVASLGSAMYYMVADRGRSTRMVRALAIRVGLSIALFLLLMAGYYFGFVPGKLG